MTAAETSRAPSMDPNEIHLPIAVSLLSPTGRIRWVSPEFTQLTGYSSDEAVGRFPQELMNTDAETAAYLALEWTRGEGFHIRLARDDKSGLRRETEFRCQPVLEKAALTGFVIEEAEIRQRSESREKTDPAGVAPQTSARAQLARMRAVLNNMLEAVITASEDGIIEEVNTAAEAMFGYRADEFVGRHVNLIVPEGLRAAHSAYLAAWQARGEARATRGTNMSRPLSARRKDGSTVVVGAVLSEFRHEGKGHLTVIFRDLTEQSRAEAQERRSRQQLHDVTAHFPGAVYQFQGEGKISGRMIFMSEGIRALTGRRADEFIADPNLLWSLVDSRDISAVQRSLYRSLTKSVRFDTTYRLNASCNSEAGEQRWIAASANPRVDSSGETIWDGVILDITNLKKVQEELDRKAKDLAVALKRAEAADRAKSEFLATMSHEIRTPMNGVIGMTSLLLESTLNPEQRDQVEVILRSGAALLGVINDILDFSRIESGHMDIESVPFELSNTLEEAVDLVAENAHAKGLELGVLIADEIPEWVIGDGARIRQILINFLANGIKFTEAGHVTARAQLESVTNGTASVLFEVEDSGIGIDEATQARLFQRFSQADSSTTRRYGGTGLGLAISRKLVELMGGQIGVRSTAGQGSTFWFRLPLPVAENVGRRNAVQSLAGKRVLVVDDDEINRRILEQQLRRIGVEVRTVEDGASALTSLFPPGATVPDADLAVLDLRLGETSGLALAAQIRQRDPGHRLPLMLLASFRDREEAAAAREQGIEVYLLKPVRRTQLLRAISEVLGGNSVQKQAEPETSEGPKFHGRILVAEDNPVNQRVVSMRLESWGADVTIAANGAEALAAAGRKSFDLIFMDCQMPEMDGFEAARRIRQLEQERGGRRVPIIAFTANVLSGDRDRCIHAGMDDYLPKPVRVSALLDKLQLWFPREPARIEDEPSGAAIRTELLAFVEELESYGTTPEDILEILTIFRQETEATLQKLGEAVKAGDHAQAAFAAHRLRGSLAGMGATGIAAIAHGLEFECAQGIAKDCQMQLERLQSGMARLYVAHDELFARQAP